MPAFKLHQTALADYCPCALPRYVYPENIQAVVRSDAECENPHLVYQAFMQQEYSHSYSRDDVRDRVIPTYMGLVKQIDDHLGRLFEFMRTRGLLDNTLIVLPPITVTTWAITGWERKICSTRRRSECH